MDKDNIKKKLLEKAFLEGFPVVKFAVEHLLKDEIEYLNKWISLGYNADLIYMQRNISKRKDVRLLLEGTRTIVVLAYPYPANVNFNDKLKIAKYAIFPDYHTIIKKKLNIIANFLLTEFKINSKCFVDTAPILEKQWALKSGIGWQGKNSLIINSILGSYFHIGIMLINIDLMPDLPVEEKCGSCKLCIDFCPMCAIVSDKVIDCRKCLTKWTIEKNTLIPENIISIIKKTGYIFGCDICQDVCPYNKNRQSEEPILFKKISKIKHMTQDKFNCIFHNSPLIRTGFYRILEYIKYVETIK